MDINLGKIPGKRYGSNIIKEKSNYKGVYDYLIFTDSRGIDNKYYKESWVDMILDKLGENLTYIVLCRPIHYTTFFTLYNFIKTHDIKFKKLITNVGFVDLTPKKDLVLNDLIEQIEFSKDFDYEKKYISDYKLSNGSIEKFYSLSHELFSESISNFISSNFDNSFLIGCFELSESFNKCIERERPVEFYEMTKETNILLREISKKENIEFLRMDNEGVENFTYDSIHLTPEGHLKVFNKIKYKIV